MEKRVTGIYFAVLVIGILYAVYAAFSFSVTIESRTEEKGVVRWDDRMEASQEGDSYVYRCVLPSTDTEEKVIVYNTVHQILEVFIDGEKIYELQGRAGRKVKTTGFCWNVIHLTEKDAGKEIVFRVTPVYNDIMPKDGFYYGTYRGVEHRILAERFARVILPVSIALAGVVMLLYGLLVVKKGQDAEIIMQFSVFAVMLGIWSIEETQMLDWIFPCSMLLVSLSHLMLMTMPIPFLLFLRRIYHNGESRLWSFCCYVNCAVITVRVLLQLTGMYDLRETLFLTHIFLLVLVAVVVIMTVREIAANGFAGQVRVNSICVLVVLASTVLELAIYRLGHISTPLGSCGFLFYIVVMGIINVRRSRMLMEQARESALYRKLAFTDELTGMPNRTAFREDLEKRMTPDKTTGMERILPTVIFMFDLNDLKKCNDTYGHDYGDRYIRMAAAALKKLFENEGECYRIGGDEFCAWTPYKDQNDIDERREMLEQEIQARNREGFVVTFSVAVGYAVYEDNEDGGGLYSTMKRADAMMYEKKQEYKKSLAV